MNNAKPLFLPQRLLIGAGTFAGISAALLPVSWQWGSSWEPFSVHLEALLDAAIGKLLGNPVAWSDYASYLTETGQWLDFAAHMGLPAAVATVGAMALPWYIFREPSGLQQDHLEGPILLTGRAAKRHARSQLCKELKKSRKLGISLHDSVQLPLAREIGNIFAYGMQGSGKSVIIKPLLAQIIERGDRVLVYDQKGEYTSLFFDEQHAVLLNPTDARSTPWNIADDATNEELAELIASRVIPEGKEAYWAQGARLIFAGVIVILNNQRRKNRWGWPELARMLSLPEAELKPLLARYYPRAARYIEQESKTTMGFLTTLVSHLSWVFSVAKAWPNSRNGFSIRRWLYEEDHPRTVIIPSDSRYSAISGPLCNALLSLMTSHVLALPDDSDRRIWAVLDELGNLPRAESLAQWLSLGRSKGARCIAGTQAVSQLYDNHLYGEQGAKTLLSMFATRICLRSIDESADRASEAFGKRHVERPVTSVDANGQQSTTYQLFEAPVVSASQIAQLPDPDQQGVQGFLFIAGWNSVYQLCWPYPALEDKAPPHISASWIDGKSISLRKGMPS
jgi:hypothetical protein